MVELLDHLGLDRVVVIGTSRGGMVAMLLAASAKERLAGVLLNDIGPELAPERLKIIMEWLGIAPAAKDFEAARSRAPGAPRDRVHRVDAGEMVVAGEALVRRHPRRSGPEL